MNISTITPNQLHALVKQGEHVELIDVRTPVEFREAHAILARNIPLDQLNAQTVAAGRKDAQQPLYLICQSGRRGKLACEQFVSAGYSNVFNVEGGTQAWVQAGLPVVRDENVVSLERQVRITAGSLVILGVLLSFLAHPYLSALSAFVGAGLVFSGITNTCGMGLLLARMPWNRVKEPHS